MLKSEQKKCDKEVEVYARCVGFYRPLKAWNPGKLAEYHDRLEYKETFNEKNVLWPL